MFKITILLFLSFNLFNLSQSAPSTSSSEIPTNEPTTNEPETTPTTVSPTEFDNDCPESPPVNLLYRCTNLNWRLTCLPARTVCSGKDAFGWCYGDLVDLPARWVCSGGTVNSQCLNQMGYWDAVGRCDLVRVSGQSARPCDVFDLVNGVGLNTGCGTDNRQIWTHTECGGQDNLRGQWTYNQETDQYYCTAKCDETPKVKCCLTFPVEE